MFSLPSRTPMVLALTALLVGGAAQAHVQTRIDNNAPAASTRLAIVQDDQGFSIKPSSLATAGYPCPASSPMVRLGTGLKLDATIFDRTSRPLQEVVDAPRR